MATVPSTYWASQRPGTGTWFRDLNVRFYIEQIYNSSTNKSTLTVYLQVQDTTKGKNSWTVGTNGTISINGSSKNIAGYKVSTGNAAAWVSLKNDSSTASWQTTVTHNADGTASVPFAVDFLVYYTVSGTTYAAAWENSGTLSLSNYPSYSLSISAGSGSAISVNRTASPSGASLGNLAAGAPIYRGDVLTVTFAANTGYALTSKTINGEEVSGSSTSVTVAGSVSAAASAQRLSYTLTIEADENSLVTVTRGGTPVADGATIYYGDALTVLALPQPGYELASATINGAPFTGQTSVNVTGDVTVSVEVSALGFAHLYRSGAFIPYLIYLWHLSAWARYRAFLWKSGAWAAF